MGWKVLKSGTLWKLTDETLETELTEQWPKILFFLTGDAHRKPPFLWAVRKECSVLRNHFLTLMEQELLCAHVEEFPDKVTMNCVPDELRGLHTQNHIIGWELSIFRDLRSVMEQCDELRSKRELNPFEVLSDVVALDREINRVQALLHQIGNPEIFRKLNKFSFLYRQHYQRVSDKVIERNIAIEEKYRRFLSDYFLAAMEQRTAAHRYVAMNIVKNINQHPECTHLITIGDAHLLTNPVYNYINLGTMPGVVDPDKGM